MNNIQTKTLIGAALGVLVIIVAGAAYMMNKESTTSQSELSQVQATTSQSQQVVTTQIEPKSIESQQLTTATDPNIINGIKVPPMPDEKLNNATLAGIDSDGNGVRDDVDRFIALHFGNNADDLKTAHAFAVAEQKVLLLGTAEAIDRYDTIIICSSFDMQTKLDQLTQFSLNTDLRGNAYGNALAGGVIDVSTERCKK